MFGCQSTAKPEVVLKPIEKIKVKDVVNVCDYIESINGKEITPDMYTDSDNFEIDNHKVVCYEIDTKTIHKDIITFEIGREKIEKEIEIIDDEPPIIDSKDEYTVQKGNEYFELKKVVSAVDNNEGSVDINYNGTFDINTVGDYSLELVAQDSSGNKSTKNIVIHVKDIEKEKVIETVEVPTQTTTTNTQVVYTTEKSQSYQNTVEFIPKTFMFADGYTFESGMNACQSYISNYTFNLGYPYILSCQPIQNEKGIYIGYKAQRK